MPLEVKGHFGDGIKHYITNQYHSNNVSFDKIHRDLLSMGIQISEGTINNIVMESLDKLEIEHDEMFEAGLKTAADIRMDDTSGLHKGKNHSYLVIQNDFFTCFKSMNSKSRIDILRALQNNKEVIYSFKDASLDYLESQNCKPELIALVTESLNKKWLSVESFKDFLSNRGINKHTTGKNSLRLIEEAALLGGVIEKGLSPDTIILSDGAPQYTKMLTHALCWIHAERLIKRLVVSSDHAEELEKVISEVWNFYKKLKAYKEKQNTQDQLALFLGFDEIFLQSVKNQDLLISLRKLYKYKNQLLCVLEHSFVPLHNNSSENDIHSLVIKRKISGGTRSDRGRDARAIFIGIVKTCRKLGISSWDYIADRLSSIPKMPSLANIIYQKVSESKASP